MTTLNSLKSPSDGRAMFTTIPKSNHPLRCGDLESLQLVDSAPESDFDNLTRLVRQVLNVPVALVSIVQPENDRQYFKSQQGLPEPWATERQTPLSHSFCQHVSRCDQELVVSNALEHKMLATNLAVRDLGVVAYLGLPIYSPDHVCIGALCAIDTRPRDWSEFEVETMTSIASCVTDAILLRATCQTASALQDEQETFTYALSHDLKSPLVSLQKLLEELSGDCARRNIDADLQLIELSIDLVKRMESQISGLSEFQRIAGTRLPLVPVSLEKLLFNVLVGLKDSIHQCQAEIKVEPLHEVQGIEPLLASLMQNILENSIKYRRKDCRPSIRVGSKACGRYIELRVTDNGIGIPQESYDKVFAIFERLHSRKDYEGTGLGLAICKRIVDIHHGTIRLEPSSGGGVTAVIRLQGV